MAKSDSNPLPHRVKDETGNVYGKLTVLRFAGMYNNHARWLCRCECGREVDVRGTMLRCGNHRSCGCGHYKANGLYHTPEHRAWAGMKQRCTNQNLPRYSGWGGRGITVCQRWKDSFLTFYEDMGPRPPDKDSVERIDNDGNYEPGNCKWATWLEQSRNTRRTRLITYNGETHCISEWACMLGIKPHTLAARLNRYGWSIEEAMTLPVSPLARCDRHP